MLARWALLRDGKSPDHFPRQGHTLHPVSLSRMGGRPDTRLPALQGQRTIAQEFMADHETALSPFRDAGFRHQFVAVRGRGDKSRSRLHDWNADDAMGFKQLLQRKPRSAKQPRSAVIEPAKIVGVKDDLGRITISELDPDSNTIHEHN
jgi:hypothetical protein